MDETGNRESDRFFVCGFLKVADSEKLTSNLVRVRDQIEAKARYNKQQRIQQVRKDGDVEQLFNFAKAPDAFELKYKHVSGENLHLFKILLKTLIHEVDFKLDALVIDREDPSYKHTNLTDMYKILTHQYFNYRCTENCIFVPGSFDDHWKWNDVLNNGNILAMIPGSSHSLLPLQVVDILTGIIGQGLKEEMDYTKKDIVRKPLVKLFEEESNLKIQKENTTVNKPRYISLWIQDFSKAKKRDS
jgi:hypothetical protein